VDTSGWPSVGEPAVGGPPVGELSVGEPSVGGPAVGELPVGESSVGEPSVGPPIGEPSVGELPIGEPSVGGLPVGGPSVGGPSVGEPSVGDPSVGGLAEGDRHAVKGMHDSPLGQTVDLPSGQGTSHFSLASAISTPQKNVSRSLVGGFDGSCCGSVGCRPTHVVYSKQASPVGQSNDPFGHLYWQSLDASSNDKPQ